MGYEIQRIYGSITDVITLDEPLDVTVIDSTDDLRKIPAHLREVLLQTDMVDVPEVPGVRGKTLLPETVVIYSGEVKGEKGALGCSYPVVGAPQTTRHDGTPEQLQALHEGMVAEVRKFLEKAAGCSED